MPYDRLLTMFIKFCSRKVFHEKLIEEAKQLEEFLDNVDKIKSEERHSLQGFNTEDFRLTCQTQALTGAYKADFNEFLKLIQYFPSNSILPDYKIFASHRHCFKLTFKDTEEVDNIFLEKKTYRNELAGMLLGIFLLLCVVGYFVFIFHDVVDWLNVKCVIPKLATSILMLLIIFMKIVICTIIWCDRVSLKDFVKKYTI